MATAFEAALAADPAAECSARYRLAGAPVSIRIAGRELASTITRAIAHLEEPGDAGQPALTIDLWDCEETGVTPPIRYFRDVFHRTWPFGRMVLASSEDEAVMGLQSLHAATIFDRHANRILGWVESPDRLSLFERGKPLQALLFSWHGDRDVLPVHAGLVEHKGDGILVGGASGSGKSTVTLMCARHGFRYLGDDYIGLPPADPIGFIGHSFYSSTWIDHDHLTRFPWLQPYAQRGTSDDDKALILLSGLDGFQFASEARIRVIALPRVTQARQTTFRRAGAAEVVLRLAPSSILQLPLIPQRAALDRVVELARRVPAFWLELGTDFEQIPTVVTEMLGEANSA
jgi:hypothetical protein